MPPSPALRGFPERGELIVDTHKQRNRYGSGLVFKEKDEDLALFNEMQSREHDEFLLKSSDDFEDAFSTKLRYFSDYKLGISVPRLGENSDLLNANGDKNDYDWLLTPPDTPLFPSLDDETTSVNLTHRGRPRSQPMSISRSSTMEKGYRNSRGSASPHRLSPSPQSRSSTIQSRGRALSAPHSIPTSSDGYASLSRRPSPPSSKPSTPAARSSSPTPRRLSTGSSNTVSSSRAKDNTSVKISRGNSASPKTSVWQSNILGFSTDVPPNLRTSLADRPASYVRGSSPASRTNREKLGRQSMSPTASRSIASSHSQYRDRFSSSKGSVAFSGDDDVDSLQSVSVGSANRSTPRRIGCNTHSNNRVLASSKKPAGRIVSSSSAPKRSFDYAMRQMDRKIPQNMFRPLLSSVPSSTFYSGKASAAHRIMLSRNSSITTSSNTSSDQGTSMAIDPEFSDHYQDDAASEYEKTLHPDVHDEVFVFDKVDMPNEDNGHRLDESQNLFHDDLDESPSFKSNQDESESFSHHGATEALQFREYFPKVDDLGETLLCSACSCEYFATKNVETDTKLCPDCRRESEIWTVTTQVSIRGVTETTPIASIQNYKDHQLSNDLNIMIGVPQFVEGGDIIDPKVSKHKENVEQSQRDVQGHFVSRSLVEEDELGGVNQQEMGEPTAGLTHKILDSDVGQQVRHFNEYSTSKVVVAVGAGISSLLLKRSSSSKGPIVEGRTFIASMIPYDDLPYTRDSTNSIRSSIGQCSVSASSSVDLTSVRQTDTRVQRQSSVKKSEMGSSCSTTSQLADHVSVDLTSVRQTDTRVQRQSSGKKSETGSSCSASSSVDLTSVRQTDTRVQRQSSGKKSETGSSCSTTSQLADHVSVSAVISLEGNLDGSLSNVEKVAVEEKRVGCQDQGPNLECTEVNDTDTSCIITAILKENKSESSETCRIMVTSTSESSSHAACTQMENNFIASVPSIDNTVLYENHEDRETSVTVLESPFVEEHTTLSTSFDGIEATAISDLNSSEMISEIEIENAYQDSNGESGLVSSNSKAEANDASDKKLSGSVSELSISNHEGMMLEEMTVSAKCQNGSKVRSLTLEEATDTILFCSSIVHSMAYQAATIAIQKEEDSVPFEHLHPTVTIPEKPKSTRKHHNLRSAASKENMKSDKYRQKQDETDMEKPFQSKTESDIATREPLMRNVGLPNKADHTRPPKLESKCNCTIM